jgi:hypothetical protein
MVVDKDIDIRWLRLGLLQTHRVSIGSQVFCDQSRLLYYGSSSVSIQKDQFSISPILWHSSAVLFLVHGFKKLYHKHQVSAMVNRLFPRNHLVYVCNRHQQDLDDSNHRLIADD